MENVISAETLRLVCFRLGTEEYAVDINRVREAIRPTAITPVPQLPPFVLGVISLRGSIMPVYDIAEMFGLKKGERGASTRIIILDMGGAEAGIIVDAVLDNTLLTRSSIDSAADIPAGMEKECIAGLGQAEGRMIAILDIDNLRKTAERIIDSFGRSGAGGAYDGQ